MNEFIKLLDLFIDKKIDFKEFDKEWQQLYHFSGMYEHLLDSESNFLDEIEMKEDMVAYKEKELVDLKQYNFVSVDEFVAWLKIFKQKNMVFWN